MGTASLLWVDSGRLTSLQLGAVCRRTLSNVCAPNNELSCIAFHGIRLIICSLFGVSRSNTTTLRGLGVHTIDSISFCIRLFRHFQGSRFHALLRCRTQNSPMACRSVSTVSAASSFLLSFSTDIDDPKMIGGFACRRRLSIQRSTRLSEKTVRLTSCNYVDPWLSNFSLVNAATKRPGRPFVLFASKRGVYLAVLARRSFTNPQKKISKWWMTLETSFLLGFEGEQKARIRTLHCFFKG